MDFTSKDCYIIYFTNEDEEIKGAIKMKFYLAPLEGITGYVYRNAYNELFGGVDRYFAPFISPNKSKSFKTKELRDVLPENNENIDLVPQLITNNSEETIYTSGKLKAFGYDEININLGCPSGTVVTKFKGSGFLAKVEELDNFLYEIFEADVTKISVKTRIGKDDPDEMYKLLEIYNKYPLTELIVHPRIQKDYYNNKPNMEIFNYIMNNSVNPVCYNGDIFTKNDYDLFVKDNPNVDKIMMGRGILRNPSLINEIKNGTRAEKATLRMLHDRVFAGYRECIPEDMNVLYKMKEFWFYFSHSFVNQQKILKRVRKAQSIQDYKTSIVNIFVEENLV